MSYYALNISFFWKFNNEHTTKKKKKNNIQQLKTFKQENLEFTATFVREIIKSIDARIVSSDCEEERSEPA